MAKENNAAVLILLTNASFKKLIDEGIPLHNFEFQKNNCSIVNKRFFSLEVFTVVSFFHERLSCVKNAT